MQWSGSAFSTGSRSRTVRKPGNGSVSAGGSNPGECTKDGDDGSSVSTMMGAGRFAAFAVEAEERAEARKSDVVNFVMFLFAVLGWLV